MTNREIKKYKQKLRYIGTLEQEEQRKQLEALSEEIGASVYWKYGEMGEGEYVNSIRDNIYMVLQTEMMLNACVSAKWSCLFAAIAAIVACISVFELLSSGCISRVLMLLFDLVGK